MGIFKKQSNAKELVALQERRDLLALQRGQLETKLSELNREQRDAIAEQAPEATIEAIEGRIDKAQRRLQGVVAALADTEQQIAAKQTELSAAARTKAISEVVAAHRAELAVLMTAVDAWVAASSAVAEAAAAPFGAQLFGVRELGNLGTVIAKEAPLVLRRAAADVEFQIDRLATGAVQPRLPGAPAVLAAPKPEPVRRVFSLAALAWRTKTAAKHQQCDLPTVLADKAVRLGYALEMTDGRWRLLSTGGAGAPPPRSECVDLEDPDLQSKPADAMGIDAVKRKAGFVERTGSTVTADYRAPRGS